jgi:hypothetical protein
MSELVTTPFKKPECGDMMHITNPVQIQDVLGGLINFQVVGTDPDTTQPVDGVAMVDDYVPAAGNVNPDKTFFICIETNAASYAVVLADGTQFTITPTQSTAYLGLWYPARLLRVLADGTTGSFSVGY